MTATDAVDLHSTQEEADTRRFLHAFHVTPDGHHSIAVFSPDTDAEVLASHHQAATPAEIILISGTRSRSRLVSVRRLCEKLGHRVCQVLPSLHALTGCDTVSSFVGKGKKKALELVKDDQIARETVQILGETIPLGEHDIIRLEKVVCKLYNEHQCDRVDELRYKMFCKGKNVHSHQLPPTRASLENHLKRANYQAYIWKSALDSQSPEIGPQNQGWQLRDGQLEIVWTVLAPALEGFMELLCCGCHSTCLTRRCPCVTNGLPCTKACSCSDQCANSVTGPEDEDDDEGDEEQDDKSYASKNKEQFSDFAGLC